MSNPEIGQMPGEIGAELVAVIGLDPLIATGNRRRTSSMKAMALGIEFRV